MIRLYTRSEHYVYDARVQVVSTFYFVADPDLERSAS